MLLPAGRRGRARGRPPPLVERLRAYRDDPRVDGLLFEYLHFYADYDHYQTAHNWYRREVRIVRNGRGIRSWKSAQGFRHADGSKLRVVPAGARIFHYGWVRPPRRMTRKARALAEVHLGAAGAAEYVPDIEAGYDFGQLHGRARFTGTHPAVMRERIAACDWHVERGRPCTRTTPCAFACCRSSRTASSAFASAAAQRNA